MHSKWTAPAIAFLVFSLLYAGHSAPAKNATSTMTTRATTRITVDTSDVPGMADYGVQVQKLAEEWYPKLVADLPSDGYTAPTQIQIVFTRDYKGVAATMGDRIECSPRYFLQHPKDTGAVVHELVHVVQHYTKGDRPAWLVEGIADYFRFYTFEPVARRPRPNPLKAKYDGSYQTTAAFLDWAQRTYDAHLVVELNAACREARYHESMWKDLTGHSVEDLGDKWRASLTDGK